MLGSRGTLGDVVNMLMHWQVWDVLMVCRVTHSTNSCRLATLCNVGAGTTR
jgi:hypothetical protein